MPVMRQVNILVFMDDVITKEKDQCTMQLSITGGTKMQRQLLRECSNWVVNKLLCKRSVDVLEVRTFIKKNLIKTDDAEADSTWEDTNIRPREFRIRIDEKALTKKQFITANCHEFVHIKQWRTGQSQPSSRDCSKRKWEGEWVDDKEVAYRDLPWEIEARLLERALANEFIKYMKAELPDLYTYYQKKAW